MSIHWKASKWSLERNEQCLNSVLFNYLSATDNVSSLLPFSLSLSTIGKDERMARKQLFSNMNSIGERIHNGAYFCFDPLAWKSLASDDLQRRNLSWYWSVSMRLSFSLDRLRKSRRCAQAEADLCSGTDGTRERERKIFVDISERAPSIAAIWAEHMDAK
jgi:hypothetical protein